MPEIPEGAKTPDDHKLPAIDRFEADLSEEELLADLPESVRRPHQLRVAQQNALIRLVTNLDLVMPNIDYSDEKTDDLILQAKERGLKFDLPDPMRADDELVDAAKERGLDVADASVASIIRRVHEYDTRAVVLQVLADDDTKVNENDPDQLLAILDLTEKIDELFETKIARDADEYAAWSEGKGHQVMIALLTKYATFAKN